MLACYYVRLSSRNERYLQVEHTAYVSIPALVRQSVIIGRHFIEEMEIIG